MRPPNLQVVTKAQPDRFPEEGAARATCQRLLSAMREGAESRDPRVSELAIKVAVYALVEATA